MTQTPEGEPSTPGEIMDPWFISTVSDPVHLPYPCQRLGPIHVVGVVSNAGRDIPQGSEQSRVVSLKPGSHQFSSSSAPVIGLVACIHLVMTVHRNQNYSHRLSLKIKWTWHSPSSIKSRDSKLNFSFSFTGSQQSLESDFVLKVK